MCSIFGHVRKEGDKVDKCWEIGDLSPEETKLMLALTLVPGIGPAGFHRLLAAFGSAQGVFAVSGPEIMATYPQLKRESLEGLLAGPNLRAVRHQAETCLRLGVRIVSHRSPAYPAPLLTLAQPLPFIFMQGQWQAEDRKALAVVGTRYPSNYGSGMARNLSLGMAEMDFTIVSGMARGIDTMAHEAALAVGGRTVAVLGSGLDWIYPSENIPLARRIIEKGCLLSEFPMGMAPHATHFPRRNRLISALSLGTLVVEAGNDSGALITAEFAMEQGREVFAVPGMVQNPGTRGPHKLIQEGAHLVETHGDIIRVLQGMSQAVPARRVKTEDRGSAESRGKVAAPDAIPAAVETEDNDVEGNSLRSGLGLDAETRALLAIMGRKAMTLEAISSQARLLPGLRDAPSHRLLTGLLELELKGKVKRMPGALFRCA